MTRPPATCVFCGKERPDTERGSRDHLLMECEEMSAEDRRAVLAPSSDEE
jgi:hypothetical protein